MVLLIFALTAIMMGMMGPRFAKFQTLLERINAIAKENLRGVRVVKSFVQEKHNLTNLPKFQMNFSAKIFISVMPFSYRTRYDASRLWVVFLSIWLVAGMAQSDPSVVGSIASFINYLSQIIFTIIMVGFLEFCQSCHDFLASYPRSSRYRASDDL